MKIKTTKIFKILSLSLGLNKKIWKSKNQKMNKNKSQEKKTRLYNLENLIKKKKKIFLGMAVNVTIQQIKQNN